jgi:hypothetical protein
VHVIILLLRFRVREKFSRARFHPFAPVSRSRQVLACAFSSFCADFAFARSSLARFFILLLRFRVREKFSRALFHPFAPVSRSRQVLACAFSYFCPSFTFARSSRVHIFILLLRFRVREKFSRVRFHTFAPVSRSRQVLACAFSSFCSGFAFSRSSRVHVFILLHRFSVREKFSRSFSPFWASLRPPMVTANVKK